MENALEKDKSDKYLQKQNNSSQVIDVICHPATAVSSTVHCVTVPIDDVPLITVVLLETCGNTSRQVR